MERFDQQRATCHVFTYREGLLSAAGHDLKIAVMRFTVEVDAQALLVEARFDAASLQVVGAMDGSAERPGALSEADKEKIRAQIQKDVLAAGTYPEIRFVSTGVTKNSDGDGYQVAGELSLHGHQRTIRFITRRSGANQVAQVSLHQPDFGIRPYRALLGTLKVRADVLIRVELPGV